MLINSTFPTRVILGKIILIRQCKYCEMLAIWQKVIRRAGKVEQKVGFQFSTYNELQSNSDFGALLWKWSYCPSPSLKLTLAAVVCIFIGPSNVFKIVKMIMERNFQPVIIFSFSKKDCEAYALQMTKLDFNTGVRSKCSVDYLYGCTVGRQVDSDL